MPSKGLDVLLVPKPLCTTSDEYMRLQSSYSKILRVHVLHGQQTTLCNESGTSVQSGKKTKNNRTKSKEIHLKRFVEAARPAV